VVETPGEVGDAARHRENQRTGARAGQGVETGKIPRKQCRRGDPYSTPTLVLRAELALAG
ncbi:MAG: hypothetical protein M0Z69_09215, partial [Actinomycetota bacterium]|nr:hypothetical protein [Actinomycetota bacterium]